MRDDESTKIVPTRLYLLGCLYPSPRTRQFRVAARCVRICARDFWASGAQPPSALSASALAVALPPGAECPAEPARCGHGGSGAAPAGRGRRGASPGGRRAEGADLLRSPPAPRPLGAGGGRGGIPLSIPAIFRAWEPGKQTALAISSRR